MDLWFNIGKRHENYMNWTTIKPVEFRACYILLDMKSGLLSIWPDYKESAEWRKIPTEITKDYVPTIFRFIHTIKEKQTSSSTLYKLKINPNFTPYNK